MASEIFRESVDADVEKAHQGTVEREEVESPAMNLSRRDFIKGIIATGIAVSSSGFLIGGCSGSDAPAPGSVERLVSLDINGRVRRVDVLPQETLAMTIKSRRSSTARVVACRRRSIASLIRASFSMNVCVDGM